MESRELVNLQKRTQEILDRYQQGSVGGSSIQAKILTTDWMGSRITLARFSISFSNFSSSLCVYFGVRILITMTVDFNRITSVSGNEFRLTAVPPSSSYPSCIVHSLTGNNNVFSSKSHAEILVPSNVSNAAHFR